MIDKDLIKRVKLAEKQIKEGKCIKMDSKMDVKEMHRLLME